jgi:hypothetical protein
MSSSDEDGSFATKGGRRKVEEDSDISSDSVYEDDTSDDDDSLRIGDSDDEADAEDDSDDQLDKEGQREEEDGDDDDSDDDDEPLAAKAGSKPAHDPRKLPPSSSSCPVAKLNQDRALAAPILTGNDDEDDSEDDDLPLAAQMKSPSPEHRRANVKKEIKQVVKKEAKNGVTQGGNKMARVAVKKKVLKESKGKGKPEPMIKKVERKPRAKKEANADDVAPNRKFEHPGQRRETPGVNDPLRLFYESMYHERIKLKKPSVLAETWMMHNGLLSPGASAKAFAARKK